MPLLCIRFRSIKNKDEKDTTVSPMLLEETSVASSICHIERSVGNIKPSTLDRAVNLRHAVTTCDLSVASIFFSNSKRDEVMKRFGQMLSNSKSRAPPEIVQKLLFERDLRQWYVHAVKVCIHIIDRFAGARSQNEPFASDSDGDDAAETVLADAEYTLRAFMILGGQSQLEIVRRSMQLVCVCTVREDVRGTGLSTSSFDLPRVRAPVLRMFISSKMATGQPGLLDYFGITHVITCFKHGASIDVGGRTRLVLHAIDDDKYDMLPDMDTSVKFVKDALLQARDDNDNATSHDSSESPAIPMVPGREDVRLLVHCAAGMHRCTVVVAAIMVALLGFKLNDALEAIRSVRPMAQPTESFGKQLKKFAARYVA